MIRQDVTDTGKRNTIDLGTCHMTNNKSSNLKADIPGIGLIFLVRFWCHGVHPTISDSLKLGWDPQRFVALGINACAALPCVLYS